MSEEQTKDVSEQQVLTGSEALVGFVAWITTIPTVVRAGAKYPVYDIMALMDRFIATNKLPQPRENWIDYLTHPADTSLPSDKESTLRAAAEALITRLDSGQDAAAELLMLRNLLQPEDTGAVAATPD